ncbi:MAG: histidine kinase dimerization/phospho-acceptor domain-containing protein [Candidatus Contendobacter sp.]|nr:histidine kinase dimerization/phospho-acceptor domain-containing protein [Candidatus Contendobacter sp.]MDG4557989.1 histidine kinase dimerization/phospho-acceptor domain-containing protein [Candidatus Contendobacter sp.]
MNQPTAQQQRLARHYNRLIAWSAVPLTLIIAALAAQQFFKQRETELGRLHNIVTEQRVMLNAFVRIANLHVGAMRRQAEDYLTTATERHPSEWRAWLVPSQIDVEGGVIASLSLNPAQQTPFKDLTGTIMGQVELLQGADERRVELDMAFSLFPLQRSAHAATPFFRWSYYFSGKEDFVVAFPWQDNAVNVKSANAATMEDVLKYWFSFDVYRLATPERNPDGHSYWTEAYLDTAGAGLIVSHAAPVHREGRYVGMVGADVLLGFLTELLQAFTERWGSVWIVNEAGQVLADPEHPYTAADQRVRTLADVLPASLRSVPIDQLLQASGEFRRIGDQYVHAQRIKSAPWYLLHAIPSSTITARLLPRLYPALIVLAGLALTLVAIHALLRRRFIKPALALVDYLRDEAAGRPPPAPPAVPAPWRPWFEVVTTTFRDNRAYLHTIETLNADLERRVEERTEQLQTANRELRLEMEVRQRAQDALHAAKAELELANRAKSAFLANMSHELRTPLNSILGYAQILLRGPGLTAKQRAGLETVRESGQRLSSLINDLLDLSKLEAPDVEAFVARRAAQTAAGHAASVPALDQCFLPPASKIAALRELAQRGDLKNLLAQADELERCDADYRPFLEELRVLARSFQVNQIVRLLSDPRIRP